MKAKGGAEPLLLRPDKAIYSCGDIAKLLVLSPVATGRVFIDVVKDGQALLSRNVELDKGRAELAIDLPSDIFGTLKVCAWRLYPSGDFAADTRLIQVNKPESLLISAQFDQVSYRPGQTALMHIKVTGKDGVPTRAAISLAGADEASYASLEPPSNLDRTILIPEDETPKPLYELRARLPYPSDHLTDPSSTSFVEQAGKVRFSAATRSETPRLMRSETYAKKQIEFTSRSMMYWLGVRSAALLSTILFFGVCVFQILHSLVYFSYCRKMIDGLESNQLLAIRQGIGRLAWRLLASLGLPFLVLLLTVISFPEIRHLTSGQKLLMLVLGVAVMTLLLQVIAVIRIHPLLKAEEWIPLRRLITLVPVAYFLAVASAVAFILANTLDIIQEGTAQGAFFAITIGISAVYAALAMAQASTTPKVGKTRYMWIALSRAVGIFLPLCAAVMQLLTWAHARHLPLFAFTDQRQRESMTTWSHSEFHTVPIDRRVFPETLLWLPELITDNHGQATVEVPLTRSNKTWLIAGSAVTENGDTGSFSQRIAAFSGFGVDIDLPDALTQHDEIWVPITVHNHLSIAQTVRLDIQASDWFDLKDDASKALHLEPGGKNLTYFRLTAITPGHHELICKTAGASDESTVQRSVLVRADGQAVAQSISGYIGKGVKHTIVIPPDAIEGDSDLVVKIYPGAFSQGVECLDNIKRLPSYGFEPTASASYLNALMLTYLQTNGIKGPEFAKRALQDIYLGYQSLLSYENREHLGGFSWFGDRPVLGALTAYAVLEQAEMGKVTNLGRDLQKRSMDWLLQEQQSDGSWQPPDGDSFAGLINQYEFRKLRTTAYIAWTLAEAGQGERPLVRAWSFISNQMATTEDPYTLALCANALVAGQHPAAKEALDRLVATQQVVEGGVMWTSKAMGLTYSQGETLDIETTSLAANAFLKSDFQPDLTHKALAWLISKKDSFGTWQSTHATVLAMRVLLAGSGPVCAIDVNPSVSITANGKSVEDLTITRENLASGHTINLREFMCGGENTIAIETSGSRDLAYQIVARYSTPWQDWVKSDKEPISIAVTCDSGELHPDDTLQCTLTLSNNQIDEARMVITDLGIPPGFEVLRDSIKPIDNSHLQVRKDFVDGRAILSFDRIPGKTTLQVTYSLLAMYPIKTKYSAATAYQFYSPSVRALAAPVELVVSPR